MPVCANKGVLVNKKLYAKSKWKKSDIPSIERNVISIGRGEYLSLIMSPE
jgi:hypothetical protein